MTDISDGDLIKHLTIEREHYIKKFQKAKYWVEELAVALSRVAVLHPDGNPKEVIEIAQSTLEKYRSEKYAIR